MKLESVDKVLIIRIGKEELHNYLSALDSIITKFQDGSDEIAKIKTFSLELTKILHLTRDY